MKSPEVPGPSQESESEVAKFNVIFKFLQRQKVYPVIFYINYLLDPEGGGDESWHLQLNYLKFNQVVAGTQDVVMFEVS